MALVTENRESWVNVHIFQKFLFLNGIRTAECVPQLQTQVPDVAYKCIEQEKGIIVRESIEGLRRFPLFSPNVGREFKNKTVISTEPLQRTGNKNVQTRPTRRPAGFFFFQPPELSGALRSK